MTYPEPPIRSGFLRARRVLTLDGIASGDAIWWQDGAIRAVGRAEELERRVPSRVPRFDLPTALVTPGLVDGHTHFGRWATGRRSVQLSGVESLAQALRLVSEGTPADGWIRGHGWEASRWEAPPDRAALDRVTTLPTCLESLDVHALWLNSAALQLAGIGRETPEPSGGRIVRDAAGVPTGLERATELVVPYLPSPTHATLLRSLREAQGEAHRLGLTGIHNVEGPEVLAAFRDLERDDTLRLRVLFQPPVNQVPTLLAHGARSGSGSEWLMLGGVKFFLDGTLGSRTAWMLEPYEGGTDRGLPLSPPEQFRRGMQVAAAGGLSCTVHAIGDAAVRLGLDLLEGLPATALPHRIEHFQCAAPADLGRAAARGIVLSMQPAHLPADVALAEERWGRRSTGAYAFRSLLAVGSVLAFGSDVPVATPDPRYGIRAAMDRFALDGSFPGGWYPGERLGFEEALRGYTQGTAIAGGQGQRRGRLAPGFDADLVAWELEQPDEPVTGAAFAAALVGMTVVNGEVVYAREGVA